MYKVNYKNNNNTNINNFKLYEISNNTILNDLVIQNNKVIINIYIKTTLNNMFITYKIENNKIITKSIASLGFKGKSKQTQYAYKTFAEILVNDLLNLNKNNNIILNLYLTSLNKKLKSFFTLFKANNIKINKIYDLTPIPYNGCRKCKISIKKKKKSIIKYLSYK